MSLLSNAWKLLLPPISDSLAQSQEQESGYGKYHRCVICV